MTDTQIRYFLTLCRCGSVTEASGLLSISQPALSKQLLSLEQSIGTKLFTRSSNGMSITPAGMILYDSLVNIEREFNRAMQKIEKLNGGKQEVFTIGFIKKFSNEELLSGLLKKFKAIKPQIRIVMVLANDYSLFKMLKEGQLDMALSPYFPNDGCDDWDYIDIYPFKDYLIFSPEHPSGNAMERFAGFDFTSLKKEAFYQITDYKQPFPDDFKDFYISILGFFPECFITVDSEEALIYDLKTNRGITIQPDYCSIFTLNGFLKYPAGSAGNIKLIYDKKRHGWISDINPLQY